MGFRIFSKTVMIAGLVFGLAACGGGGGGGVPGVTGGGPTGGTTPPPPTGASLLYIIVTSGSASLPKGISEQFIATGIYSDGSKQSLTASAAWSSSNPAVATISNSGVAAAVGAGTTTITATAGITSLSYNLTVTNAALNYISVTPPAPSVGVGQTRQLTATGAFSDGSTLDITSSVSWSSSNISIAKVNSSATTPVGLATGVSPGTVIITANSSGTNQILASTTLTVAGYGVSGLLSLLPAATSVVLQNNLTDDVTLSADGTFMFNTPLATGATYNVTVLTQPTGVHPCNVVDGSGTIATSPVTSVQVVCATAVGTLAGTPNVFGTTNGPGPSASFYNPSGVAYDATSGNLYVADTASQVIRVINPAGVVSTLAGTAGMAGFANGTGAAATFFNPTGVAVDNSGNVYVADSGNNAIRKITMPGAVVSTLAGSGLMGATNSTVGTSASFNNPNGVAVDAAGNVYVADTYNYRIRKVTSAGAVSTFAGTGTSGGTNGAATSATFNFPSGVAVDSSGKVYVADSNNGLIRLISAGQVTTFAGAMMTSSLDGPATSVSFGWPVGLAVDAAGNVYVGDRGYHLIRKISAGNVTTYAGLTHYMGSSTGSSGFHDGPAWIDASASSSAFYSPSGVAVDAAGNVYVADTGNHLIRKIMP